MSDRNAYAEKHAVKIDYRTFKGSGVVTKIDTQTGYLITAKHNFRTIKKQKLEDIIIAVDDYQFIEIVNRNGDKFIVDKLVYDEGDLVIFLVQGSFSALMKLEILTSKPRSDLEYFSYGFPSQKKEGHFFNRLHSPSNITDNGFLLRNPDHNSTKYIEGASGSGVFVENNEKSFYLKGIVVQNIDPYSDINVLNLSNKILLINSVLRSKEVPILSIKEVNFDLDSSAENIYNWLVSHGSENFLVHKAKELFGTKHRYSDLTDSTEINYPSKNLKKLNEYMCESNEFEKTTEVYTQKLADMYLLGALISIQYPDKLKALEYFNEAIKFRPQYIILVAEFDKKNSKNRLLRAAKVAFIEKIYIDAKNYFNKFISLNIDRNEKILAYEYLVKIAKATNTNDMLENYYRTLIEEYDDHLKIAVTYYELSLVVDDFYEQKNILDKGLLYIDDNSDFLEIRYFLYKRKYELEPDKELYKVCKSTLKRLVLINPDYNNELLALEYEEAREKTRWSALLVIPIIVLMIVFMWEIYNYIRT